MTQERLFGNITIVPTGHFIFEERPTKWLIAGILNLAGTGILSGQAKLGKTWVLLEAAISIASGLPFLDRYDVVQGPVLLRSPEGPTRELEERIGQVCRRRGLVQRALPLYIVTGKTLALDSPADQETLLKVVRSVRPVFIGMDPFVRCFDGVESNADDVKRATGFVNELAQETGAAVMLTHHNAKDGSALRGSGVLLSFGDCYWLLNEENGRKRLEFILKHGASPAPLPLALTEENGDNRMLIDDSAPAAAPREPKLEDKIGELMGTNPAKRWTVRDLRQEIGGDFTKYKTALNTLRGLRLIKEAKGGGYLLNKAVWFGKAPKGDGQTKPAAANA